jgi:hypothetical protein
LKRKKKKQNASGIEQIKIRLKLKESYPTNKSHTLIIEIENGEKTVLLFKTYSRIARN